MKNSHILLVIISILFNLTFIKGYTQENSDENTYIINQYFQLNNQSSLSDKKNAATTNKKQAQSNFVTLNQLGNYNQIDIKQNREDSQKVNQIGNKNYYNFISYYNNTPSKFNILQQGNANNLQIYGENAIIKNISIVQKSDFKTLIIKNY